MRNVTALPILALALLAFDAAPARADGTPSVCWFPTSHRYAVEGSYIVTVTAIGCTRQVETTPAVVGGAETPGCPSDAAPPCHEATPCRYLDPYNMHLVDGGTSPVPLHLRAAAGARDPAGMD